MNIQLRDMANPVKLPPQCLQMTWETAHMAGGPSLEQTTDLLQIGRFLRAFAAKHESQNEPNSSKLQDETCQTCKADEMFT